MIVFMGAKERQNESDPRELLEGEEFDPRHFYAAYIFDAAEDRRVDVNSLLQNAKMLGYPVRYWWLSDVMDLQGYSDRLIVCVHHPSNSENAGMDLFDMLRLSQANWDDLEPALVEEYCSFGKPVDDILKLFHPTGTPLFPEA